MGVSRTLNDVAIASNIRRTELSRTYRILVLELDLKVPMIDLVKCIVRVANKADISEKTKYRAMNIMKDVTPNGLSAGKDPIGSCCVNPLFIVPQYWRTQDSVGYFKCGRSN